MFTPMAISIRNGAIEFNSLNGTLDKLQKEPKKVSAIFLVLLLNS